VPEYWTEHAGAWLQGFDGVHLSTELKPVGDQLEAELDEGAISEPRAAS